MSDAAAHPLDQLSAREEQVASPEISSEAASSKWIGALIIAVGTAIVLANWLLQALSSPQTGWDFPVFYIAAKLPIQHLYDHAAFASVWRNDLAPLGVPHWAPFVRPAAFGVLLHPLASFPYFPALWSWISAEVLAFLIAVALLVKHLQLPLYFIPAAATFFPALGGIISGQDNAAYLLLFVIAIILLNRSFDVAAGMVLVLCLCKFNLAVLLPVALIAHKRYRAFLSFSLGCVCVAGLSLWLTPFRTYLAELDYAQANTAGFYPVGLRGFSVAIGQPWCYPILAAIVAAVCCWLMLKLPLLEAICVALAGALLISPYVTWYDSTLLIVPVAVVFASGNSVVRWSSLAIIAAVPLWEHGGGNNGPIGFTHVSAEVIILILLAPLERSRRLWRGKAIPHPAA